MSRYIFLNNVATAEVAYEAFGKNYNELFENCALALEEVTVLLESVTPKIKKVVKLESDSVEDLLFSFLEELVYLKDAERLVFSKFDCKVTFPKSHSGVESDSRIESHEETKSVWRLKAILMGETIDSSKHKLDADIKAVTRHMFKIIQLPNKSYKCTVVLDV